MTRTLHTAFIAFGANLGDPEETLTDTAPLLLSRTGGTLVAQSSLYETKALTLDGSTQPNYLNAVLALETALSPLTLLSTLLEIEKEMGRNRDEELRWSPRAIDLDLLFVGELIHKDSFLTLPHPELHKRDFVLTPLKEIAPHFTHPTLGSSMLHLENSLEERGFERFVITRVEG